MTWKRVTISDVGTATKWGADDTDKFAQAFSGLDVDDIDMNCDFWGNSSKFGIWNPGRTFKYLFVTSAIAANRNITIPLLTGNVTMPFLEFAQSWTADQTFSDTVTLGADTFLTGVISPAQITSDQNDYSPTGMSTAITLRLTSDTTRNITGLATGANGRFIIIHNIGTNPIVLKDESVSSTAANRFALTSDLILSGDQLAFLHYDNTSQRWRAASSTPAAAFDGNITGMMARTGVISPTQLVADTNDWNPTNLQTSSIIRVDTDSSFRKLTGITAPSPDNTRVLTLRNVSANTLLLCDENASSSAANRFSFQGYDVPLFPKEEIELKYDITLDRWYMEDLHEHIIPKARYGFYYRNDMMGIGSDAYLSSQVSGSGAANSASAITNVAGHPGVVQHQSGTTTTGEALMGTTNMAQILLGNSWYWRYEAMVRITTLSDGTDRYNLNAGFLDGVAGSSVDGVMAIYSDNNNSGKWTLLARNNSVSTFADDTGTAVAAGTWYRIVIKVFPAGAEARLFINGTEIAASLSSGLPTGAGRGTGYGSKILKSLGTTSRSIDLDYIEVMGYANTVA